MTAKPKGLGRGLSAIFDLENVELPKRQTSSSMEEVRVGDIKPNPKQPRVNFDEDALEELADSIKVLGVIQPVTLRSEGEGYVIISGERRWRASQMAGLETIPAYIREADDQQLHEMALVENIQRQDLNAMEVALSLQRLIDECNLTQDVLSERVGKKRSTVANYMRLLRMPVEVQSAVRDEYITMGHAKAIASAPEQMQLPLLKKVLRKNMSVRQVEELVRKDAEKLAEKDNSPSAGSHGEEDYPESYARLVEQLERLFSQDISIKKDRKGGGKIVIEFSGDSDIETFLARLEKGSKK